MSHHEFKKINDDYETRIKEINDDWFRGMCYIFLFVVCILLVEAVSRIRDNSNNKLSVNISEIETQLKKQGLQRIKFSAEGYHCGSNKIISRTYTAIDSNKNPVSGIVCHNEIKITSTKG